MTTTPTLREAAQQALEALEALCATLNRNGYSTGHAAAAITAAGAALAEQGAEQAEPVAGNHPAFAACMKIANDLRNHDVVRMTAAKCAHAVHEALLAAPPAPARQEPLTDEQIDATAAEWESSRRSFTHGDGTADVKVEFTARRLRHFARAVRSLPSAPITAAPAEGGAE